MGWAVVLLLSLATWLVAPEAHARRVVYAVAIGNNQPPATESSLRLLRYADDDAARYHELFSRLATRVELLTVLDTATQSRHPTLAGRTLPPTLSQLRATMREVRSQLQQHIERGDEAVLFLSFSGHGSSESTGEYSLSMLDGGLTQRILYDDVLAGLERVQIHLFIDACHAAGVVGVRGAFDRELDAETVTLDEARRDHLVERRSLERFPNVGVIVASNATEEAHEWSRIEAGVFTHEILSALSGAADVNGDRRIEYSEVQAFVAAANRGLPVAAAKPNIVSVPPAANQRAVLVDLKDLRDTTYLTAIPSGLGHFHIESSDGQRLIDAHLEHPQGVVLAVPKSNAGLYLRNAEREAKIPLASVVEVANLQLAPMASQTRGGVDSALHAGLFANAYGPAYYRGYVDSMGLVPVNFGAPRSLEQPAESQPSRPAEPHDVPAPKKSGQSGIGTSLAVVSGVSLVAAASLGIAAFVKRQEYDQNNKQRPAAELADQFSLFGNASLAAAAVGVATGIGATILLLPRATVQSHPAGQTVAYELLLQSTW